VKLQATFKFPRPEDLVGLRVALRCGAAALATVTRRRATDTIGSWLHARKTVDAPWPNGGVLSFDYPEGMLWGAVPYQEVVAMWTEEIPSIDTGPLPGEERTEDDE
jgi:hypothetical protein